MSHMVETMAYAGQLPWHGLGTRVSENISVDEMMVESGLDWEVQKVPLTLMERGSTAGMICL